MLSKYSSQSIRFLLNLYGFVLLLHSSIRSVIPRISRKHDDSDTKIFRPAIATMSLGKPGLHSLETKLRAASAMGFQGIELFWDDLEAFAQDKNEDQGGHVGKNDLLEAARKIKRLCIALNLEIISLQPFRDYDGLRNPTLHRHRLTEFRNWLLIAQELHTKVIGVPPTINADVRTHTGDQAIIILDLIDLAALAKPYGICIAYENLYFGAHVRSWQNAWEIVEKTGELDTVKFLPDTFNICGDVYADPTRSDGQNLNAAEELRSSLEDLVVTLPPSSIPFIQVADAERLPKPITPSHAWMKGCTNAKMAWSRNARLYPLEKTGYLPVIDVVKAVVETGWSGYVSQEVFTRATQVEGEETIWELADRAWKGWERLAKKMRWKVRP